MIVIKLVTKIFKRDDWYITSPFGSREPISTKNGTTSNFHNGCDYGTNCEKWPQYAIEHGTIINCGIAYDGAKYIWVEYPRINKKLLHYHLDSICVKNGEKVDKNTLLGYTGKTGKATGIHLHLGMKSINNNLFENPDEYDYQEENSDNDISNYEIAYDVIKGKYGNGEDRIKKLNEAGYNATIIQNLVNQIINQNDSNEKEYIVVYGDTLSQIAEKFNTTYEKIYEKNKNIIGEDPNIIKPGQKLKI